MRWCNKHLVGFEALIRLPAPDGTLIPPDAFLPLAEEMRLIDKIGNLGAGRGLPHGDHLAGGSDRGGEPVAGAIRIRFARGHRADAQETSGLKPHRLELEILESLLLKNTEAVMATLKKLKGMGVSIVMDDF